MKNKEKSIIGNFHYLFQKLYLYKWWSIVLPFIGSVMQVILSIITIFIPKVILDLITNKVHYNSILYWIVLSGIVLFIVSIINIVVHNEITICSQGLLYTCLTKQWQEKMMNLNYEIFTSDGGKIKAEKARNSISSPNWGVVTYASKITELLESIGGFLAFSTIISMLHPYIIFLLLIMFGIEMWYGAMTESRKHSTKEESASANRKLNYIAYGTRGIKEAKDIRIYSMISWLREIMQMAMSNKDNLEKRIASLEMRKMLLNGFLIFVRNGCAYVYLVYEYFHGGMTIGDFTLYFTAITGVGSWLDKLTHAFSAFMEANHYVDDFRQFMSLKTDEKTALYNIEQLTMPVSFTWDHVSFSYYERDEHGIQKEIPVLRNINVHIKAGEKLAIVGTNGAGKTTFVKLLCGLIKPKDGKILINGFNSADFNIEDYCKLFSAVFQKSGVLPVCIRANIALNIREESDEKDILNCIKLANLDGKINSLPNGIDTCLVKRISEEGTELSGGELQRLLLARALYKNAPVLILDEPTAALDPIAENEIYQKYNQFTEGKTAIFISHRLASTRFCDRIIVMDSGNIVEMGTHEELIQLGGKYAEMFEVQSRYYKEAMNE